MLKKLPALFLLLGITSTTNLLLSQKQTLRIVCLAENNTIPGKTLHIQPLCAGMPAFTIPFTDTAVSFQTASCSGYSIQITAAGFDTFRTTADSALFISNSLRAMLRPAAQTIAETEIIRYNEAVKISGDKTIIDATKLNPGAVATLLDLLIKCPGVMIDESNNVIRLKGKTGTYIMVEGRLQPMQGETLFNWLRNTPAQLVEKIELISNPSARYDASGQAGLINFRFKQNKQKGQNVTLSSGLGQGRYGKLTEGIQYNYRKNKWAFTGIYNYALRKGFNQLSLTRKFYNYDSLTGGYAQSNYLRIPVQGHAFRASADKYMNTNTTFGFSLTGNATRLKPNGKNYCNILDSQLNIESYFSTINLSREKWQNGTANIYLRKISDTLGSSWSSDADAAVYHSENKQLFTTEYFDKQYIKNKPDYLLAGNFKGLLQILAFKADRIKKYNNEAVFETGIKASHVVADNDVQFGDASTGIYIPDSSRSNHFIYEENIGAAYVQYAGKLSKYQYQLGCRGEQTLARGNQKTTGQTFRRSYGQLFPTFALSTMQKNGTNRSLSISRRIERPDYSQLNPFTFYLDPSFYRVGNPTLSPQLTWSMELQQISARGRSLTFTVNHANRLITEVLIPSEQDVRVTIQTNKNLNSFYSVFGTIATPLNIRKFSSGYWTVTGGYQQFTGNLGNTPLSGGSIVITASGNQSFMLNKKWTADINGSFQSGQMYAYMHIRALGQVGVGIQRSLFNRQGTIKLTANDLFFTGNPVGESRFSNYNEKFIVHRETRVAMLSFSYRIGPNQSAVQRRQGGAEEEKQRAQNKMG
ncbi:MAG: outer membrane beta-barrel protein [Bacteroidetes bacterium]|nr:outer membrane beta-barrel protein [Bacteroidota bacterium]